MRLRSRLRLELDMDTADNWENKFIKSEAI